MRLSAQYVDAIKSAAREAFGPGVVVRLFGSRVHDEAWNGLRLFVEQEGLLS